MRRWHCGANLLQRHHSLSVAPNGGIRASVEPQPSSAGADSVLLELLNDCVLARTCAAYDELVEKLNQWADMALRTLVWCKRELPEFEEWHRKYLVASQSPDEVAKFKTGRANQISALQAELESEFMLQGATAIEDQLQVKLSEDKGEGGFPSACSPASVCGFRRVCLKFLQTYEQLESRCGCSLATRYRAAHLSCVGVGVGVRARVERVLSGG